MNKVFHSFHSVLGSSVFICSLYSLRLCANSTSYTWISLSMIWLNSWCKSNTPKKRFSSRKNGVGRVFYATHIDKISWHESWPGTINQQILVFLLPSWSFALLLPSSATSSHVLWSWWMKNWNGFLTYF
jgi:hypothetical protein